MSNKILMTDSRFIIKVPSSYVVKNIKMADDTGKGEAKLHIGPKSKSNIFYSFFNNFSMDNIYKIDKYSILTFLNSYKNQFLNNTVYKDTNIDYFNEKLSFWQNVSDIDLVFELTPYTDSTRFYIRENPDNFSNHQVFFKKIREICLPNFSSIVIDKNNNIFTFRLFKDTAIDLDSINIDLDVSQDICSDSNDDTEEPDSNLHIVMREGATKYYLGRKFERNQKLRNEAISMHGLSCHVCNFNFEDTYGDLGKNFIEVHHKTPLSHTGEVFINPKTDLVPLCSNCHRMIHRNKINVLSVDELINLIKNKY